MNDDIITAVLTGKESDLLHRDFLLLLLPLLRRFCL